MVDLDPFKAADFTKINTHDLKTLILKLVENPDEAPDGAESKISE